MAKFLTTDEGIEALAEYLIKKIGDITRFQNA